MNKMASTEFSLDEACFLRSERLIQSFAPIKLSDNLVHPVRISMATVRSICSHNSSDWFEEAIELMKFIHSRYENVEPNLYRTLKKKLMRTVVLNTMVTDTSSSKLCSWRVINRYFPTNADEDRSGLLLLLSKERTLHEVVEAEIISRQGNDSLSNSLEEYFKAVEEELPSPLKKSEIINVNGSISTSSPTDHVQPSDGAAANQQEETSDVPTDGDRESTDSLVEDSLTDQSDSNC